MKDVIIVGSGEGITIRAIESKLSECNINSIFIGVDRDKLSLTTEKAGLYLVSFQGDLEKIIGILDPLIGYAGDNNTGVIVIADKSEQALIRVKYAKLVPLVEKWYERDMDMNGMVADIRESLSQDKVKVEMKHVLIVDDDPTYAKMVREWLKDIFKVSVVVNAMQAIAFMTKQKPDLVLLDYEMPIVTGPQVLEMMRAEPETSNMPVVFLTGVGDPQSVAKVVALKPTGYLLKSTSKDKIREWLMTYFYKS